jgi:hypothetical protein
MTVPIAGRKNKATEAEEAELEESRECAAPAPKRGARAGLVVPARFYQLGSTSWVLPAGF